MKNLRYTPLDTWFFRESRPMDAIGGTELASIFPPSPRTLMGAMRTAIGDGAGVDWHEYAREPQHPLRARIGHGDDYGPLTLAGPWLCKDGARLYPAPLFLLEKGMGDGASMARLRIGQAVETHLGRVRLPELPTGLQGLKPLERAWLSQGDLERVLAGKMPEPRDVYRAEDLFQEESRLAIARDRSSHTADEGLLYQTRHLRPGPGVGLEADVSLDDGDALTPVMIRLGGEGRLAHIATVAPAPYVAAPRVDGTTKGLILVLMTAARFGAGAGTWLPPGFMPERQSDGTCVWQGQIAGVDLSLHAAVLGKAQREGGWNMAERCPRQVESLIPPGSAFYVTTRALAPAVAIQVLHGAQVGEDQALGRGHLACALWNLKEYQ